MSHYLHAQKTGPDSHLGTSSCCCACTLVEFNDVGFSYCLLYKHGAGGSGEGQGVGTGWGGALFCLRGKLQCQVSRSNSYTMQRSFAAWKYLRHHCSCRYRWRRFIVATFPSLSFIHLSTRASLGYLITPSWRCCRCGCANRCWRITAKSPSICI